MPEQNTDMQQVRRLLALQKNELTEHHIYTKIATITTDAGNRDVLLRIAQEELGHYRIWRRYTGTLILTACSSCSITLPPGSSA
jgi:rubrerythrin